MPSSVAADAVGLEALHRLKSTEPPLYLTPSPELSKSARLALQYLFSSLNPYAPKSPFSQLLTEGFDAEQIWQQIDLQAQPLFSSLRRHVRSFEKNPQEIEKQFNLDKTSGKFETAIEDRENKDSKGIESESDGFDIDEDEEDEGEDGSDDEDDEDGEEHSDEEDGEMAKEETKNVNGVEDKFLKIKELEEYLVDDEAREYEDFFGGNKTVQKKKSRRFGGSVDLDMDDDINNQKKKSRRFGGSDDSDMDDDHDDDTNNQKKQSLSTHEKELEKLRSEIEEIEKANLEPKTWTMQGEVTAAKRPKNSALEVDLDFEHNVRPAPVITEEVTASLEELIQKRVLEGRFDDVPKPPTLSTKGPREKKELDDNKSKKGLAELYEDDYAQKTGLVSTALSFSDEQKKEASMLFKKLCVKLDALSHFHFTPKPVIEDMSIQANVPALAMEEIAPLAVSDAAMLAPEEVFSGKGDVKEEAELTKEEKKRRRANKKRKFKAKNAKRTAAKAQLNTLTNRDNGNEDS
ncbi:hypothetical protein BUALT_Bualt02G0139200 [Buddleja alternifolia]|uniref:Uncharacterized protein n=1 Tax=Buddleja alternifolia TaxID=168488 RepID=A0AAV6Y043_9LAMI|nr:hypothetical protein BUALT_Bualt02G0139200 [Buddleja alternifolia]